MNVIKRLQVTPFKRKFTTRNNIKNTLCNLYITNLGLCVVLGSIISTYYTIERINNDKWRSDDDIFNEYIEIITCGLIMGAFCGIMFGTVVPFMLPIVLPTIAAYKICNKE